VGEGGDEYPLVSDLPVCRRRQMAGRMHVMQQCRIASINESLDMR
jgi:hypothetical protein